MTKNSDAKESLAVVKVKRRNYLRSLIFLLVVVIVGVSGYKLWEKPLLLEQVKEMFLQNGEKEDLYYLQIEEVKKQINLLQSDFQSVREKIENPDFSDINKRIEALEQLNLNTIKSKADVETVLGLIVRMDNAEGKIADLAKVTNKSALVLMSAMLVKDAAERGGEFVYEAEVLNEIVKDNVKIAKELELINKISVTGIATKEELQNGFADVYAEKYAKVADEIEPKDWKERIFYQINKIIKIKKTNKENAKEKFSEEDRAWSVISDFVLKGEIKRATAIARKPLNEEMLKNEKFMIWLDSAEMYNDFYDAISRISANSLAVMKVEFLNNVK